MADTGSGQRVTIQQALELATAAHLAGQAQQAETFYRQILAADPNQPDALHQLGILAINAGQFELAGQLIERAIAACPDEPAYHSNLGFARASLGRNLEAIESCRAALSLSPDFADAMVNLGNSLATVGAAAEAIDTLQRAILIRPGDATAWNALGSAFQKADRWDEAINAFHKAAELMPGFAWAHLNLGTALLHEASIAAAMESYERAVQLEPSNAIFVSYLGTALLAAGRMSAATEAYRRAILLDPNLGSAHFNLAMIQLLIGDYENGWKEYEWRFKAQSEIGLAPLTFPKPVWDGSRIAGKTILLHAEQGLGDTIHFARYAALVARQGANVILSCQPELVRIMKTLPCELRVVRSGDALPEFDLHCPLPSLPLRFGTRPETIPADVPYLHPGPADAARWKARLAEFGSLKVGIVWAGSPKYQNDRHRSLALRDFAPLALSGVQFFSLQKGPAASQISGAPEGMSLTDWTDELTDFAESAALISNLDLVISVDTSTSHLAGALGKPTWVLLPFSPDWRWMLDRSDSPWYPTMKLFRQPEAGEWKPVIEQVARALQGSETQYRTRL